MLIIFRHLGIVSQQKLNLDNFKRIKPDLKKQKTPQSVPGILMSMQGLLCVLFTFYYGLEGSPEGLC